MTGPARTNPAIILIIGWFIVWSDFLCCCYHHHNCRWQLTRRWLGFHYLLETRHRSRHILGSFNIRDGWPLVQRCLLAPSATACLFGLLLVVKVFLYPFVSRYLCLPLVRRVCRYTRTNSCKENQIGLWTFRRSCQWLARLYSAGKTECQEY